MNKETGGHAFPTGIFTDDKGVIVSGSFGITTRDYFAAKALPGCMGWGEPKDVCAEAYKYADAMLEARK
jgi:hypothetical protein